MTYAPTPVRSEPDAPTVSADATASDFAARGPLLLLLGSGIVWLVISEILGLIASIQLHSPHFLAQYSFLTHGRVDALQESAFIYGWAANAGLAIGTWVLARLGGNPLRATNWLVAGTVFWNLGLTVGLVGIAVGDLTSFSLFQLPRYVQPLMLAAYAAMALAGFLAWTGRRIDGTFASQWYALAALVLFPWLSSLAQLVLLWSPLRGVTQNIGAAWYAQGVWAFWLAPFALAGAYYVAARSSKQVLPNYDASALAFWILIAVGSWIGGRHLVGGPVPAWVGTLAVVGSIVLLVHYGIVGANLRILWGVQGTSAGFIRLGLIAYLLTGIFETLTSFRGVAVETQFTFLDVAIQQLALYGGLTMLFFGTIYFMVPRLTGHAWASSSLTWGHRILVVAGVSLLVVTLAVAGWTQGVDLLDPKTPFGDIFDHIKLTLLVFSGAQLVLIGANLLLLVNFLQTISTSVTTDLVALSPVRLTREAPAP